MKQEFIRVGRIVNAHGIRGELRVQPRQVEPAFLAACRKLYLDGVPVTPASHVHKSLVLMKLPGVEDMNTALTYKNKDLYVRRSDVTLPEGQYFDEELLDMEVYNRESGALLGRITRIDPYPASKVYTVEGQRRYLIPAVPEVFIAAVDLDNNRMDVNVWEGLAADEH